MNRRACIKSAAVLGALSAIPFWAGNVFAAQAARLPIPLLVEPGLQVIRKYP